MGEQRGREVEVGQVRGTAAVTPRREQPHLFFSEGRRREQPFVSSEVTQDDQLLRACTVHH